MKMRKQLFIISILLLSGCATVDKALVPVDNAVNQTKSTYQSAGHSISETMNDLDNNTTDLQSSFYESSLIKLFLSDDSISKNREQYYVSWNNSSGHIANKIIKSKLADSEIKNPDNLKTSQKMVILKDHFFDSLKNKHARAFSSKHKKPEFNEFLTDRENIEKIHQYKTALAESEHVWRISLQQTKKEVAELMLSTLYSTPLLKYISYDPYNKELFLSIESLNPGFKQKIRVDADKIIASTMKDNISQIKPYVFFKFNEDTLEFVGINIKHKNKAYICTIIDNAFKRQSDVIFTSEELSLKALDVQYYNVVKNIKPPEWFNNIKSEENQIIGFGEGINKDNAKKEAFSDIAMSIKTTVSSDFESEKVLSGSTYASNYKSSSKQKVEDVDIKGSKVLKIEKKDGLWFVAILYES